MVAICSFGYPRETLDSISASKNSFATNSTFTASRGVTAACRDCLIGRRVELVRVRLWIGGCCFWHEVVRVD
jgi:hypothetical protein